MPSRISRSTNIDWQNLVELTARVILGANLSLADVLFSSQPEINKLHETQRGAGFTACLFFTYRLSHRL
jgi:hypothetical protein